MLHLRVAGTVPSKNSVLHQAETQRRKNAGICWLSQANATAHHVNQTPQSPREYSS